MAAAALANNALSTAGSVTVALLEVPLIAGKSVAVALAKIALVTFMWDRVVLETVTLPTGGVGTTPVDATVWLVVPLTAGVEEDDDVDFGVTRTYPYSVEKVRSWLQFVTVYLFAKAVSVVAQTMVIVGS